MSPQVDPHRFLAFALQNNRWQAAAVGLAIVVALLLPLNLLASQPFHHDEALYATWALKIVSGDDPWLANTPIDKPPLFLYTLAAAMRWLGISEATARVPSFLAAALIVLFIYHLGNRLYNPAAGVLAAWLTALSPFIILFTPTAFTDSLLAALALASCLAAAHRRAVGAGVCLALAVATKQQAIFFLPLVILLLVSGYRFQVLRNTHYVSRFTTAFLLTLLPFLFWDLTRRQPSAFFEQSLRNYGGLTTDITGFGRRWQGFVDLLAYATASPALNIIFLVGCPLLLIYGIPKLISAAPNPEPVEGPPPRSSAPSPALTDWTLALFCLAFLLLHALFSFQVWDRYLLGLIPLLALLLARTLLLPWLLLKARLPRPYFALSGPIYGLIIMALLFFTLAAPVQNAVNARYPLGSNSRGLQGIHQITAYLQGHYAADNTLYHHWLGAHWRFYLWRYPYDLQYWDSPAELAAKAKPGHLIAFPAWRSETGARLALFQAGLGLRQLTRAYAADGSPSITLYRIESVQPD